MLRATHEDVRSGTTHCQHARSSQTAQAVHDDRLPKTLLDSNTIARYSIVIKHTAKSMFAAAEHATVIRVACRRAIAS